MPDEMLDILWNKAEAMQGKIAAEVRVLLKESALPTSLFTPDQIQRRIDAMKKCAAESTSDVERHDSWIKMHVDAGWTYAPGEFDPVKKTHPNLLPWDQLPDSVKSKARIFDIVSKAFFELEHVLGERIRRTIEDRNSYIAHLESEVNRLAKPFNDALLGKEPEPEAATGEVINCGCGKTYHTATESGQCPDHAPLATPAVEVVPTDAGEPFPPAL